MTALTGGDLVAWLTLRRVCRGGIAQLGEYYFDWGRPVPRYTSQTLTVLVRAGLVVLAVADPESAGLRRVGVSEAGRIQYVALCIRVGGGVR